MPEHVHVHAPHELNEGNEAQTRRERTLEIVAAFLLSLATLAIAWSGYQAARWSGLQAEQYSEATASRSLANRHQINAGEQRVHDLLNFNRWLEEETSGNTELTALYERRFRDEFRPCVRRVARPGLALHEPRRHPHTPAHAAVRAAGRGGCRPARGARGGAVRAGKEATENADAYVFTTVFFAVVLFFSGISLRFEWVKLRLVMLVLAAVFLICGLIELLTMPVH